MRWAVYLVSRAFYNRRAVVWKGHNQSLHTHRQTDIVMEDIPQTEDKREIETQVKVVNEGGRFEHDFTGGLRSLDFCSLNFIFQHRAALQWTNGTFIRLVSFVKVTL